MELEESIFLTSDYTTKLQSSSLGTHVRIKDFKTKKNKKFFSIKKKKKDSMVLAQKQKHRPMEQNRKPRNKPLHLWAPYF